MTKPNIVKLVADGSYTEALSLYSHLRRPHRFTFPPLLKACAKLGLLSHGQSLHAHLLKTGFVADFYSATALTSMYGILGCPDHALKLLDEMPQRSTASLNAAVSGLAQNGLFEEAFKVLRSFRPNSVTLASLLSACGSSGCAEALHCWAVKLGVEKDVFVSTAIVSVYSREKVVSLVMVRKVFDEMSERNLVSYNAYLSALLQRGLVSEVFDVFKEMREGFGERPNRVTLVSVVSACAGLSCAVIGGQVHGLAIKLELVGDVMVGTALVDMYLKCGFWERSYEVFEELKGVRNLVTWNAMISGLVLNGQCGRAQALFRKMRNEGLEPDLAIWNSLIGGFSQLGKGFWALKYLKKMQSAGIRPDLKTLTIILSSCSEFPVLRRGKEIHGHVIRINVGSDKQMATTLVDFYMKCGLPSFAKNIFDDFVVKPDDPAIWNAMISGFGRNGDYQSAFGVFDRMLKQNVQPNSPTFMSLLSTCSHSGLVEKGREFFRMMSSEFGLKPKPEHFSCMVDLLARCGRLRDARELIKELPRPSISVFASLLSACRSNLDPELGEEMAQMIIKLQPNNPMPYLVLSNIYAELGRWSDSTRIRGMINHRTRRKSPGFSLLEATN